MIKYIMHTYEHDMMEPVMDNQYRLIRHMQAESFCFALDAYSGFWSQELIVECILISPCSEALIRPTEIFTEKKVKEK